MSRELRLWKVYASVATFLAAAMLLLAFRFADQANLRELTVQRINVVGPDGKLQLMTGAGPSPPSAGVPLMLAPAWGP